MTYANGTGILAEMVQEIGKGARELPSCPALTSKTPRSTPEQVSELAPEGPGPEFCLSQELTEQLVNLHHLCPRIRDRMGATAAEGRLSLSAPAVVSVPTGTWVCP